MNVTLTKNLTEAEIVHLTREAQAIIAFLANHPQVLDRRQSEYKRALETLTRALQYYPG